MQLLKILSAVALLSQAILAGPRIQRTMATAPVSSVPNPVALLCGLHGLNLFLVQFDYVPSGVAVTLENCYELCLGIDGYDICCQFYEFYPEPGTNAPRCNLHGANVAKELQIVNSYVPNVWYDLGCGSPSP